MKTPSPRPSQRSRPPNMLSVQIPDTTIKHSLRIRGLQGFKGQSWHPSSRKLNRWRTSCSNRGFFAVCGWGCLALQPSEPPVKRVECFRSPSVFPLPIQASLTSPEDAHRSPSKGKAAVQPLTIQRHVAIHDIHSSHTPSSRWPGMVYGKTAYCTPDFSACVCLVNGYRTAGLWARGSCSSGPSTPALPGGLACVI
ncbi:hypothetical protein B0T20DRAFT_103952 [Sordaria brevicollis]|uniref:Uncharacterized protein n=1 Tax=Sordaria brevicollis TaxID=83679 RepID=A0AAE0NVA0_SORBR|nr:hypothetical protein B0T20DRAFT_103952 [Sordaria brevicollis]